MSDETKLPVIEWEMMDRKKFLLLTVANSFFLRSAIYPFVVVKTRLQVQRHNSVYSGSLDAFMKIMRSEGFCGLYRGFWINSVQVFSNATYIIFYEMTRNLVTKYTNFSDSKTKAFLSGGISSAMSQTLIIPFDIVSQHIMVSLNTRRPHSKPPSEGFKSTFFKPLSLNQNDVQRFGIGIAITRQLYREGGFKSFYKGYFASLLCYVPSSALWWMFYYEINEFLSGWSVTTNTPYLLLHCMSGTLSGASTTIVTNPLDLLRANIQVHRPSSYRSAVRYLWKEEKWRIFTKGLTARLTQSCISSGLIVIGYEGMKRYSIDEKYRDQVW